MKRVGVFVCGCGTNISSVIDTDRVALAAAEMPSVVFSTSYKYMCSDPGQDQIKKAAEEHNLNQIIVASCSPRMHENTFRKAMVGAGLNPYQFEMVNIREQVSWVHADKDEAAQKAIDLIRMAVAKVTRSKPLQVSTIPVTKKALVIGAGIAGMQAALDIAETGHQVILVERDVTIGGKMAQLDKTFPTMDCSA